MRDFEHKFAIAYNRSSDKLKISFPNAIKFPHVQTWVWLQDVSTVVLSPIKPKLVKGAQYLGLNVVTDRGCRIIDFGPISHGIGRHFRNAETSFRHEDERFFIKIPDGCDRLIPKNRGKYAMATVVAQSVVAPLAPEPAAEVSVGDHHLVLIERGDQELSFNVPESVLKDIIGDWVLNGFLAGE